MEHQVVSSNVSSPERLPTELLHRIISMVASTSDPSSLIDTLLTSKRFYDVGLPVSVSVFRNTSEYGVEGYCSKKRNLQFLRYILVTKPQLAKYVNKIILGLFTKTSNRGRYHFPSNLGRDRKEVYGDFSQEDLQVYQRLIQDSHKGIEFSEGFASRWAKRLEMGCVDSQVAFLVMSCPNLRSLYFPGARGQSTFRYVLKLADPNSETPWPGGNRPLSRLEDVYLESGAWITQRVVQKVDSIPSLFLLIPSLRSLEGVDVSCSILTENWIARLPHRISNLESIVLRRADMTPRLVKTLMATCKAVKRLEIIRGRFNSGSHEAQEKQILEAILPHAKSLEHLHLDLADDLMGGGVAFDYPRRIMSEKLKDMTALKTLVTGMCSLIGGLNDPSEEPDTGTDTPQPLSLDAPELICCLPENLEYLEIHRCCQRILDQAQDLISAVESGERFKRLKHLKLRFETEKISRHQVNLRHDPSKVRLEIVFQSLENRVYDAIPNIRKDDKSSKPMCSRIYRPGHREEWLANRDKDIGTAN